MAQAPNRPLGSDYNPVKLSGDKREWPLEAPAALQRVIFALGSFFSGKRGGQGPLSYRIYFHPEQGTHGTVVHVLQYAATGAWTIAPGDLQAMLDAGLVSLRSNDSGTVSFYFAMPETHGGMKAELRRAGY
jgi:hypothetical protein